MKKLNEIITGKGIMVDQASEDGGSGWIGYLDPKKPNKTARVVWSNGAGWDHVSVSWNNRCPTWEEMVKVKRLFFNDDETVVQYHPSESNYVNFHPYCLHLWRKQDDSIPLPATWMVGPKDG